MNLADFGLGVDTDEPLFEHHSAPTSPAEEARTRATASGIVDLQRAAIPDTGTAVLPQGSQHPDGAHHTTGSDLPVVAAPLSGSKRCCRLRTRAGAPAGPCAHPPVAMQTPHGGR